MRLCRAMNFWICMEFSSCNTRTRLQRTCLLPRLRGLSPHSVVTSWPRLTRVDVCYARQLRVVAYIAKDGAVWNSVILLHGLRLHATFAGQIYRRCSTVIVADFSNRWLLVLHYMLLRTTPFYTPRELSLIVLTYTVVTCSRCLHSCSILLVEI